MKSRWILGLFAAALVAGASSRALAGDPLPCHGCGHFGGHLHGVYGHLHGALHSAPFEQLKYDRAQDYNWHGYYYNPAWGQPVALVVPPTAKREYNWGWGVGTTRLTRINHQFGREYPGGVGGAGPFYPTPPWPNDTTQFGYYYVRGPW